MSGEIRSTPKHGTGDGPAAAATILAVSWACNIAHEATFETLASECRRRGLQLVYAAPGYAAAGGRHYRGSFRKIDRVVLVNTHPRAIATAARARLAGADVTFMAHEPIRSLAEFWPYTPGLSRKLKLVAVKLTNDLLLALATDILVFSRNAEEKISPANLAKVRRTSLRFPDREGAASEPERMISYIGTIAEDHHFDAFVAFAAHCIDSGDLPDCRFGIFTRSAIPDDVRARLSSRSVLVGGRTLPQDEMDEAYRRSAIVWCSYGRTTQSGVLPMAYMFGRPILGSARFDPDHFRDGREGMVPASLAPPDVVAACRAILSDHAAFSRRARDTFTLRFDAANSDLIP